MSNIDAFRMTGFAPQRRLNTGTVRTFSLAEEDCQQLQRHLNHADVTQLSFLDHVLRRKVKASQPLEGAAPEDVVTGSSCVRYVINGGSAQTGLMRHWARRGSRGAVIPVRSLLGAALIGMRIGERAPLLNEDGSSSSLTVLDIIPPT